MAFMFVKISGISRAKGGNALNKAAYISRDRLVDQRTGEVFDHSDRRDLVHAEIKTPQKNVSTPDWATNREALWSQVELMETRSNARTAREVIITLPHEMPELSRFNAANQYAQLLSNRYGVAADLAIHRPPEKGDYRNNHAHILLTPRVLTEQGFTERAKLYEPSLSFAKPEPVHYLKEFQQLRLWWAQTANNEFIKSGLTERLDALTPRYRSWLLNHRPNDTRLDPNHSIDTETPQMKNDRIAIEQYWAYRREHLKHLDQTTKSPLQIASPHAEHTLFRDNDFSL